ncbi:hypothetical protein JMJ55_22240 [Belnapia sp. T6]|uniref:PE-PGRS family protein n=1 Tax=Belnapia mucosa TaxID=2804532 RepID=A0ABS1V8S8_9PROT|nr:hypothetical protein [Belnapia mucosa]MBL6458060.1 hypothetical protein [Belnapia mucosa]
MSVINLEQAQPDIAADARDVEDAQLVYNFTSPGSISTFTVQVAGLYSIEAIGGSGGTGNARTGSSSDEAVGGFGAEVGATFDLNSGDTLTIVVAAQGGNSRETIGPAGGAGATFVTGPNDLLVVAGGGGGGAVGGNEAQSRGTDALQDATAGKAAAFIHGESVAGGAAGSNGDGGGGGPTSGGGDGYGGGGGGGYFTSGGSGGIPANAGGGGSALSNSDPAGGSGGAGNGGPGGFGGGGGGGYLGGGGGGGGYNGGGGGPAVENVGGGGGAGGSFVSSNSLSVSFATASAHGNGSVVLTLLDDGLDSPLVIDWNALAARATANFEATGQWFLDPVSYNEETTDWNALAAQVTANYNATGQWYL